MAEIWWLFQLSHLAGRGPEWFWELQVLSALFLLVLSALA
jgi:hypothetical protein